MSSVTYPKFKAAVVQASSVNFDLAATMLKLEKLVLEAKANDAKLILFPEAFVSAYPKGSTFTAYIGGRKPEGRDWFRRYHESSVIVPGPETDKMAELSKEHDVYLVVGVIEKDGGTLYCSIVHFSPTQGYLGKHRKLMPTAGEKLVWGFGDGSTLPVFDTSIGKIGSVICWENYMPLLRTYMYSKDIQIYCAPTADDRDSWVSSMQHIAKEGRCYVLGACQFSRRSDYPKDYPTVLNDTEGDDTVYFRGGSCIVNPMGELIVGPNFEGETILYADLDLKEIVNFKWDFDVVGHYSRPDIFKLNVNTEEKKSVTEN